MLRYQLSELFAAHAPQTKNMKHLREVSRPFYTEKMLDLVAARLPGHYQFTRSAITADGSTNFNLGLTKNDRKDDVKYALTCEWSDALQLLGREAAFRIEPLNQKAGVLYFGETWHTINGRLRKAHEALDAEKIIDFIEGALYLRPCPKTRITATP